MTFSCDCEATPSLVVGKSSLTKHRYGCGMFRTDKAEWRAAHALLASLPRTGKVPESGKAG